MVVAVATTTTAMVILVSEKAAATTSTVLVAVLPDGMWRPRWCRRWRFWLRRWQWYRRWRWLQLWCRRRRRLQQRRWWLWFWRRWRQAGIGGDNNNNGCGDGSHKPPLPLLPPVPPRQPPPTRTPTPSLLSPPSSRRRPEPDTGVAATAATAPSDLVSLPSVPGSPVDCWSLGPRVFLPFGCAFGRLFGFLFVLVGCWVASAVGRLFGILLVLVGCWVFRIFLFFFVGRSPVLVGIFTSVRFGRVRFGPQRMRVRAHGHVDGNNINRIVLESAAMEVVDP
jgi:hypothetical protein